MVFRHLAKKVKDCISQGDTAKAIQLIKEALQGHPLENTIIVRAAQQFGLKQELIKGKISWEDASLTQNQIHSAILKITSELAQEEINKTKVFISYTRDDISSSLALKIRSELKQLGFPIFMDREDTPIGADWAVTILNEIKDRKSVV